MGFGLAHALDADPSVQLLASDLGDVALEDAIARGLPQVAIVGEATDYGQVLRLTSSREAPAVLVLAHEGTLLWTVLGGLGITCLALSSSIGELVTAVHLLARDGRVLRETESLTERELEVLGHLSEGLIYAEIALKLGIAQTTVKTHSARIRRKLKVKHKRALKGRHYSEMARTAKQLRE